MPDPTYDVVCTVSSGGISPTQAAALVAAVDVHSDAYEPFGLETLEDETTVATRTVSRRIRVAFNALGQQNLPTASQQVSLLASLFNGSIVDGSWTKFEEVTVTPVP